MNFNKHSELKGTHALFGPSQWHWVNYDEEKLASRYKSHLATLRGTELHAFAEMCVALGQKLPRSQKTLNMYVNDAIGFKMTPEQPLYYSPYFYGTADAISFRDNFLRIHDLKTGKTPAHIEQLLIYAALFCLEYGIKPGSIQMELRLYQNDDILIANPTAEDILPIMNSIIAFDKAINKINREENGVL